MLAPYERASHACAIQRLEHGLRTRAPASERGQRGASPLQANALRPVTESNCVAVRRGGEQLEVNDQSVG